MITFLSSLIFISFACKNDDVNSPVAPTPQIEVMEKKIDTVGINYLMGKFDPENHPLFVKIPKIYADKEGLYLRKEALEAFQTMHTKAKEDGIDLIIKSATRNFNYQKGIWERKWLGATTLSDGTNFKNSKASSTTKALKILEFSSMPGTSRHHWGTDIDLNNFNNSWFEKGEGQKVYEWLVENAKSFGFVQVYTPINEIRPNGYQEEKWHWSYVPLSGPMTLEAKQALTNEHIEGFYGSEVAVGIDVVGKYILGVNPSCFVY